MPRGDLLSWKAATFGSAISVMASSTITIRSAAISSRRSCARMERRSNLMACGIFCRSDDGVFFTAGIADEEHGLFGLITEDEN